MKVIAIAALLASASLSLAAPTNKPATPKNAAPVCCIHGVRQTVAVKTAGVPACCANCACPMGAAMHAAASNAAHVCPMNSSRPMMGSTKGVTAVNAAQTCPMNSSCPMMGSAKGVTAANAAQTCPMMGLCPMGADKSAGASTTPAKATLMKVAVKQCGDNCTCGKGASADADNDDHIFTMKGMGGFFHSMMGDHDDDAAGAGRPRLGVSLTHRSDDDGLVVASVMDGFPADKAGLKEGNVIVSVNGASPATADALRKALNSGQVTLGLKRDGETRRVTIKLDSEHSHGMMRMRMDADGDHDDHQSFRFHQRFDDDTLAKLHELGEKFGKMGARMRLKEGDFSEIQRHLCDALKDLGVKGAIIIKLRGDDDDEDAHSADKDVDFDVDINLDDEAMAKISKALKHALQVVGEIELDENAPGASDHAGAEAAGEREHHARMKIERLRADHAQSHDPHPHLRDQMDRRGDKHDNASGARNPDTDARLKKLEERMERIEQLLQQLLEQG